MYLEATALQYSAACNSLFETAATVAVAATAVAMAAACMHVMCLEGTALQYSHEAACKGCMLCAAYSSKQQQQEEEQEPQWCHCGSRSSLDW